MDEPSKLERVGAAFLGGLCPDLCREDVTMEEISTRIKSYGLCLSEHWRP